MKKILSFLILVSLVSTHFCHAVGESLLLANPQESHIIVNNRILAKVNGKAISVIDLMKKMDLLFYRQFPQYTSSQQARFQFYQMTWKSMLSEMIDKELILADAQESKLEVSAGDVRQEMEASFGPNIIANLDKAGLTFSEASQMILSDITIRRMLYFKAQLKAMSQVTPQHLRAFYDQIANQNLRDNEWIFNVVTIRHRDPAKAAEIAHLAHQLLTQDNLPLAALTDKIKEIHSATRQPTITVSEELHTFEKELSDSYRTVLSAQEPNTYSNPIAQKSRSDNSMIFRIFYFKKMIPGGVIPFSELESKIKEKLLDEAIEKETEAYVMKLRRHFNVREDQLKANIPSDFQPFVLK